MIYTAFDKTLAGYMVLSDTIREESAGMVDALNRLGVAPVLLTGDHENAARAIAEARCTSGRFTENACRRTNWIISGSTRKTGRTYV